MIEITIDLLCSGLQEYSDTQEEFEVTVPEFEFFLPDS